MKNIWDYDTKPLTELLEAIVDNRGKTVPTTETGRILIATNCVTNNTLFPVYEKVRFISDETYETWFRAHPIPGDIIFVNKGTPGKVCMVPDPIEFCIAQDMIALRANDKEIYNKYLFAVLRSERIQKQIYNTNVGDVIPHFKKQFLDQLLIPIPPREIQEFIGNLYYQLSYKIELNKQINDNLEQQAQALYKSWFIDFEPFKDSKFIDSELGSIPEGWQVGKAEDFYEINIGKTPPRKEHEWFTQDKSQNIWVSISDLGSDGTFVFDSSEYLTDKAIQKHNIVLVPENTVLLSFKLTIGRVGIAGTQLTTNEAIARFITNRINREYTYFLLKNFNYSKLGSTSSIATAVNSKIIKAMTILMPSNECLRDFNRATGTIMDKIKQNEEEVLHLTALRDSLLPKLMSGEFKINEIDC